MRIATVGGGSRTGFSRAAIAAMLLALIAGGCGDPGSSGGGGGGASSSLASGVAHGAFGPIVGATVTAYKAGTSGFGTGAVAIATAITNSKGAFNFTSGTCNTGDAIYYVSRGGNAGGGVNSAIALMSEVGLCESLPNSVTINEVTTVASVYALAQFIGHSSPYPVGTSATNVTGLKNAFANVGNLVNITTGFARSAMPAGGTVPQRNLNTIANALISCVNSIAVSASCSELFDCAKPGATFAGGLCSGGTGTTPTDTLGATLNTALNPARVSVPGIFSAATIRPFFTPSLGSAPGTLVLALNPSFGLQIPPGFSRVAIDAAGNVWITSFDALLKSTSSGALAAVFDKSTTPGGDFDSLISVAIDAAGNVWFVNIAGNSVTKLTSSGALVGNFNNTNTPGADFDNPNDLAIDATGNAWVTNAGFPSPVSSVTKLNSSGALLDNFNNTNTPGAGFFELQSVAIDAGSNVWLGNGALNGVTKLTSAGALLGHFNPGGTLSNPNVAFDAAGNAWATNGFGGNPLGGVVKLSSSGILLGDFNKSNIPAADFGSPNGIALDSAGNVWVINQSGPSLVELTSSGALVGNFEVLNTGAGSHQQSLAIDAAGDVWVIVDGVGGVTEFVGAARPVRTPLVACLKLSPPHAVCLP